MTSGELRDYATVVAATVALLVFIVSSYAQVRNRRIENLARFNTAHQRLFAERSYIARNIIAIEAGTLKRDRGNAEMEAKFHLMSWGLSGWPSWPTTRRCRVTRKSRSGSQKKFPKRGKKYLYYCK
jgi:hypothetical protein